MVKCAKFAGREPATCTRGQACRCLNEPFGNPEQLEAANPAITKARDAIDAAREGRE